ncbi:hypothetical protein BsWGS_23770 [Bradybaena similaris]
MTGFLSNKLALACVLPLLLTLIQHAGLGATDKICDPDNPQPARGICGQQLANLVSSICSYVEALTEARPTRRDVSGQDVMLGRKDALSFLSKRQRTGYIVCECCIHYCDVYELLQYCTIPDRLLLQPAADES